MAWFLRTLTDLTEDMDLVLSTYMVTHKCLRTELQFHFLASVVIVCMWFTNIHADKTHP